MRIYKCDRCLREMTTHEINTAKLIMGPNNSSNEFCLECENDYYDAYRLFHKEFMTGHIYSVRYEYGTKEDKA